MELVQSLLLQAINGESEAEEGYKRYAEKARSEGFPGIGSLFLALSRAEAIHIANHERALMKNGFSGRLPDVDRGVSVSDTLSNLENAVRAEYDEFKNMYPSFRKQISKKYGDRFEAKIALLSIKWANESERQHHNLLKKALDAIQAEKDVSGGEYYLCTVCGNIEFQELFPSELCSVCGHDISFYTLIKGEK